MNRIRGSKAALTYALIVSLLFSLFGGIEPADAQSGETTLFSDTFEDGTADDWTTTGGTWSVVSKNTSMQYQQSELASAYYAIAGDPAWTHYAVEMKVTPDRFVDSGSVIGLVARYTDLNNRYTFLLGNGKLELSKTVAGVKTVLDTKPFTATTGRTYNLKAVANRNALDFYIDGTKELTAFDTSLPSGKIGLAMYKTAASFDDVTVSDLSAQLSSNADLQSLQTSHGALTPEFDNDQTEYILTVDSFVDQLEITAQPAGGSYASLSINGESHPVSTPKTIDLIQVQQIHISVTAEDGVTVKQYSIDVEKSDASTKFPKRIEAELFAGTKGVQVISGGAIGSVDNGDWVRYDNVDLSGYTDLKMRAAVPRTDVKADIFIDAVEVNGSVTGGTYIGSFTDLSRDAGFNDFSTRGIALSTLASGTHKIYVKFSVVGSGSAFGLMNIDWFEFTRDTDSNADLKGIEVSSGHLMPAFDKDVTAYTLLVYDDLSELSLTPQVMDVGYASLKINGESHPNNEPKLFPFEEINSIVLSVTAEDGTQKTYTVNVQKRAILEEYYVSPTGIDSIDQDGTAEAPWKTLSYACTQVPADKGATIRLAEGTFVENEPCNLPAGVSIAGAGSDKTIVKSTIMHALKNTFDYAEHRYTIHVADTSGVSFSGFKMTGMQDDGTRAHAGLFIHEVSDVLVHDMEFEEFNYNGVWITNAVNSHLYNLKLFNNAIPNSGSCTGNIMIADLKDSSIHDIYIRENRGAYGIKNWAYGWTDNPYVLFPGQDYLSMLENIKFYNLDIDLRQRGGWGAGQPNIAIETWSSYVKNVEIFNNRFADNISLVGTNVSGSTNSVRVHHNQFIAEPAGESGYTYSIELSVNYAEVDHNYFKNGYYPIANFGGKKIGHYIHDNVFDQNEGVDIMHYQNDIQDFVVENNIIIAKDNMRGEDKGKLPFMQLGGGTSDNSVIRNNIFFNSPSLPLNNVNLIQLNGANAQLGSNFVVANNLFFNWKESGTNAVTGDPLISPDDLRLRYDSPAYAMGIHDVDTESFGLPAGYTYSNPDEPIGMVWLKRSDGTGTPAILNLNVNDTAELEVNGKTKSGYAAAISPEMMSFTTVDITGTQVVAIDDNGAITATNAGIAKVTATVTLNGATKSSTLYVEVADLNPPMTTATVSSEQPAAQDGWYSGAVTVDLLASDDALTPATTVYRLDQRELWIPYTDAVVIDVEGTTTIQFRSTDAAGNTEDVKEVALKIDKTSPTITLSTHSGSVYTIDQTVTIACQADDVLSGVANTTCQDIDAPAYTFGTGTETFSAIATDLAGNLGSGTVQIEVKVTLQSLIRLIQQLLHQEGANNGIIMSLTAKLAAAQNSHERGNYHARDNQLNAFRNEVAAQKGKKLTEVQAELLNRLAEALDEL